jgi:hypothetical protein
MVDAPDCGSGVLWGVRVRIPPAWTIGDHNLIRRTSRLARAGAVGSSWCSFGCVNTVATLEDEPRLAVGVAGAANPSRSPVRRIETHQVPGRAQLWSRWSRVRVPFATLSRWLRAASARRVPRIYHLGSDGSAP